MNKHKTKISILYWFTLVELIVVIMILSILSTIWLISYKSYVSQTRDSIRVSDIKTIANSLQIHKINIKKYPESEWSLIIEGLSKQWYFKEDQSRLLKINKTPKDPKDWVEYIYSTDIKWEKYQLWWYLEENNELFFSYNWIINQAIASSINYKDRYFYSYWDRVWVILDSETNGPINEKYSSGQISIPSIKDELKVHFTNSNTNSWIISWTGEKLNITIWILQNSCILWWKIVSSWNSITWYLEKEVEFWWECRWIQRTCENGELKWDTKYAYSICEVKSWSKCESKVYNGYLIPEIKHNESKLVDKLIPNGWSQLTASCFNGELSYGNEVINCWEYAYDDTTKTCNENKCSWEKPIYSQINGIQKYNILWKHNVTYWECNFICQAWYYWKDWDCKIAQLWNYVWESWKESQEACNLWNKYQDKEWQTKCEDVDIWYYSTPVWNVSHTGQKQCEENSYCTNWIKYWCPVGTNSQVWSTSIDDCKSNYYKIEWVITNWEWWKIDVCWSEITIDASGNYIKTGILHWSNCSQINLIKTWYTCSIWWWPTSIWWDVVINWSCIANTYTATFNANGWWTPSVWSKVVTYNTAIWTLPIDHDIILIDGLHWVVDEHK